MKIDENDLEWVARHYRRGAFDASRAWRRLAVRPARWWTRGKVAAASVLAAIVVATAAVVTLRPDPVPQATPHIEQITAEEILVVKKVLDFEQAPLAEVIKEIELTYGVEIENVPADADTVKFSLHYEGTAPDLVNALNEALGSEMRAIPAKK